MSPALLERPQQRAPIAKGSYQHPVARPEVEQVLTWLDGQKNAAPWIGFLLRMENTFPAWLAEQPTGDPEAHAAIRRSAEYRAKMVLGALEFATGPNSAWNDLIALPSLHACGVRAPAGYLKKMLESKLLHGNSSWVSGLLVDAPVPVPDDAMAAGEPDRHALAIERLVDIAGKKPGAYLPALYPSAFSARWGQEITGAGQSVCILDSGCDEWHFALREQVQVHAFFDSQGYYKEAKYATDRGSHGTGVTGLIVGKSVSSRDLFGPAAPEKARIGLGLAPDARAVVVNVLQGGPRREQGTLAQVLAGLDWAVRHMHDPTYGGYEVVCMSMERHKGLGPFLDARMDDILGLLRYHGLAPILAGGNHGPSSQPLGTAGTYVGAADSFGKPWHKNGRSDFLAPGVDLLVCQPPLPQLDNGLVACSSGTSLATAVTAAAVILLVEASGYRRAPECLDALKVTAAGGLFSLDKALAYLNRH